MITQIENLSQNVIGFNYSDNITATDYEKIVFPALEKAAKGQEKIRIIFRLDTSFGKLTTKAMMDDAFVGLKYFRQWERIAIVSDDEEINHAIKVMRFLLPGYVRIFPLSEMDKAKKWVSGD